MDLLDEGHSTVEQLATHGRWGRIQAFRCALAVERIRHTNRSTVYSFNSQRILFQPYQYKPLLKILGSLDRRLLIADEVGLGKTIEAGLILTELDARRPLDKVLVACPSRLRDKWREELNRKFDQDFEIHDKASLLNYIARLRDNPRRSRLRAIASIQTLRSEEVREQILADVGNLELVIVDEAHHARNPSTKTSEMLHELGQLGDCVLLLTATPLHLGSQDLFTLLNAIRPTEFRDANVFERDLRHHRGVIEAEALVRSRSEEGLSSAIDRLQGVFTEGKLIRDPVAEAVIEEMKAAPPKDRRGWVDLERQVQELHPLSSILTRTRKRDVQEDAPIRRARVVYCDWTDQEDDTYQTLVAGSGRRGWIHEHIGFAHIQRARQAASCLPATVEKYGFQATLSDDEAVELTDILPTDIPAGASVGLEDSAWTDLPTTWGGPDSKYEKLRELLAQIWDEESAAKVLLFSFFKGTVTYLARRLEEDGFRTLWINGDVPSTPRQPERDERGRRIRQFRDDPEIRILLSTEVGSEGLDFQFCHHIVNYDLPWNPMVVEQRIGRIDRFGQESEVVHIHNLVVAGTVEDKILFRLYDRIGIFAESIGDLEEILGETVRELQRDYVSGRLTPEEADRRVDLAASAIKRRRLHLEQLQTNAGELFGHEQFIRDEMERVGRLGRFVSEKAMISVLRTYLQSRHPDAGLWEEKSKIFGLRLTDELRAEIQDAARGGQLWVDRSKNNQLLITTHGETAFRNSVVELLNVSHPLIRAAVAGLSEQLQEAVARVGQATVNLAADDDPELADGFYFVVVYTLSVDGIRARKMLETIAWSQARKVVLDSETSERLLHLVTESGQEWERSDQLSMSTSVWRAIESEMRARRRQLVDRERRENEALYVRRKRVLEAEHEHDLNLKRLRLETAKSRGRSVGILRAFQGQIDKADSDHRERLAQLEQTREVRASFSDPVAACLVEIQRP